MLTPHWVILFSLLYIGLLFWVARRGDRQPEARRLQPYIYGLSLATYCTSWSFYGTVEQFSHTGWWISPLHLGVIFLFIFGWRFLDRLIRTGKSENATTVADFVAARYGHARIIAIIVAVISLVGVIPYIALQLKAVSVSFSLLTATTHVSTLWWQDQSFYVAILMAAFSIIFGTRHVDTSEHHQGLMHVIALESIIKLIAFLIMGIFAVYVINDGLASVLNKARQVPSINQVLSEFNTTYIYLTHMMLGLFSIFCLPRQFHVAVVENQSPRDLPTARWVFPLYLVLINLFVQPIALAGQLYFGMEEPNKAYFSLLLPLQEGNELLALIAYIGGLSAGTSMVILATVALSSMASNELLMPLAIRFKLLKADSGNISRSVLMMRRISIILIMLTAYGYFRLLAEFTELVTIGMLSMVAVAQFAPAILLGMWWTKLNRRGALIGLVSGFAVWIYTLVIPVMAHSGMIDSAIMNGPFGIAMLKPNGLFGLDTLDPIVHGTFWSLVVNITGLILGSIGYHEKLIDQLQANRFVEHEPLAVSSHADNPVVTIGDINGLLSRFVREDKSAELLRDYRNPQTGRLLSDQVADADMLQRSERLLGSVIGTPAARLMIGSLTNTHQAPIARLTTIVDEASHMLQFSRDILNSALQSIEQGISIVDRDLNIVAWNKQYQLLFPYPDGLLQVGQPAEHLIRYRAEQGEFGDEDIEVSVRKRLTHLASGEPYRFVRQRPNNQFLEIQGSPMPGGGYITTYSDITERRQFEQQLQETNERLEEKVDERTLELTQLNAQLQKAHANKTRFLAAAGHDLVQPLNSAALFTSSLIHKMEKSAIKRDIIETAEQLEQSLESADALLSELLEISKLDSDIIQANIQPVAIQPLFDAISTEFSVVAHANRLRFDVIPCSAAVTTDAQMLRRIIQNLLSNAFRYTRQGRIILGVRHRGDDLSIEVHDTGIGIPKEHLEEIFDEFQRLPNDLQQHDKGLGLGLAIVKRMCSLLGHTISVRSERGRGSVFAIQLPRCHVEPPPAKVTEAPSSQQNHQGQHILCVDNEAQIVDGMTSLLQDWGYQVSPALSLAQALDAVETRPPDLVVIDYHLDHGETGLNVMSQLEQRFAAPCIVITADYTETVAKEVAHRGYYLLKKPVKPLALRSLISEVLNRRHQGIE